MTTQPCFRCRQFAELPVIGSGIVAGQERDQLPLCTDCLELLTVDCEAFWRPLRKRQRETEQ
jgi:hypothetical protein